MKLKHLIPCLTLLIGANGHALSVQLAALARCTSRCGHVIAQKSLTIGAKRFLPKTQMRIVIITDTYYSSNRGLGHASVGVVKANSQAVSRPPIQCLLNRHQRQNIGCRRETD